MRFNQLLRFASVGVLVTIIDFGVLNVLLVARIPFLLANIISVSISMIVSYFLNKKHVFGQETTSLKQKILFIAGTMFALYVLQSLVIHFLSLYQSQIQLRLEPLTFGFFTSTFIFVNATKLVATVVSTVWNYVFYRFVVFREVRQ